MQMIVMIDYYEQRCKLINKPSLYTMCDLHISCANE